MICYCCLYFWSQVMFHFGVRRISITLLYCTGRIVLLLLLLLFNWNSLLYFSNGHARKLSMKLHWIWPGSFRVGICLFNCWRMDYSTGYISQETHVFIICLHLVFLHLYIKRTWIDGSSEYAIEKFAILAQIH